MMPKTVSAILLPLLVLAGGQSARAEDIASRTDYAIAIAGLPLASARFETSMNDADYTIRGRIKSGGLTNFIAETTADVVSQGRIRGERLRAETFRFSYRFGKRERLFDTRFAGGNVVSSEVVPEPNWRKKKNWVPIKPEHLRAVTDPISGLVLRGDADPCDRRIAIYDGEARVDFVLASRRSEPFRTEGFDGSVVACNLIYEPKSGYRKGHREVTYVSRLRNMEIWFAKSSALNVYAPVFLSVPTKYGTLTVTATHFEG